MKRKQMIKRILLKLFLLIFCLNICSVNIENTSSLFTDVVDTNGLSFSSGEWDSSDGDGQGGVGGGGSEELSTVLTVDNGLVIDEKVENGDFRTGGSIADWNEAGSTDRLGGDFEVVPYDGEWMARVGDTEDYGNNIWANSLSQLLDSGNKNLSFYYNFYSYDYGFDQPGFSFIINDQTVWDLYDTDIDYYDSFFPPDFYDTGDYDVLASTYNTGWQQTCIDLTQFGDDDLNAAFYAGNNDEFNEFQSWVYLDKVTTTEVVANGSTEFYLSSSSSGATRQYFVQEGEYTEGDESLIGEEDWVDLTGDFFTLSSHDSGEYAVFYRSIEGSLVESPNIVKVHLDKEAPEAIDDLAVYDVSTSSAMLNWTVKPDLLNTDELRPASYDIRYWQKEEGFPCDPVDWDTADQIANPPMPRFPEEIQDFEVTGLTYNTSYCFAIKTCDNALNCSSLSTGVVISEETGEEIDDIVSGATLTRDDIPEEGYGDVVINELMWMGSQGESADEWVELRNMTGQPISLADWQIVKKKPDGTEQCMFTFPVDAVISAYGFLVVSEFDEAHSAMAITPDYVVGDGDANDHDSGLDTFTLYNTRLQLKLYDGFWTNPGVNLIDVVDDWSGAPAAGEHDIGSNIYYSMERNDTPGDGTNPANWHSCLVDYSFLSGYWDNPIEKGTPGGPNLSSNDPTFLQTELDFYLGPDKNSVGFEVTGISLYSQLKYEVTYSPQNRETQGIVGTIDLNGDSQITKEDLVLGTASSGDWVYDLGMDKIYLKIVLTGNNLPDRELVEEIDY